jgi:hypothetical protein
MSERQTLNSKPFAEEHNRKQPTLWLTSLSPKVFYLTSRYASALTMKDFINEIGK